MDVTLPNGRVISGVPEGTSKEAIKAKAISSGLATAADFGDAQNGGMDNSSGTGIPDLAANAGVDPAQSDQNAMLQGMMSEQKAAGRATDELAVSMATGAIAEPLAGFAGAGAAIMPGGQSGAEAVESARQSLTFQPKTEKGQQKMQALGSMAESIPDVGGATGDFVFDLTGNPELATVAATTPTLVAELVGLGILKKIRTGAPLLNEAGRPTKLLRKALDKQGLDFDNLTPEARATIPATATQSPISGGSRPASNAEAAVMQQIKSGGRDDALAGIKVVGGKIAPDKAGLEAVRQGFDAGFVQSVKTADKATRDSMAKMLTKARRIKSSRRVGLDTRPTDIIGDAVTDRVKFIRNKADGARVELNQIASEKLSGVSVDTAPVLQQLEKSLGELDVQLVDTGTPKPSLEFSGSMISKDRTSQRIIKDVVDLMAEGGQPDALRMHKLKRQLDSIIDFRKKSAGGLTDAGRGVLKDVRRSLNDSIRAVDSDYARVNDTLSQSLTALDDFQQVSGKSIDVFGEGANKAIGTDMRALMSNRKGRVNIENALNQITETATNLGGKFSGDIKDMVMFADGIEDVFGATARTSLKGEMESAMRQAGQQGATATMAEKAVSAAARGAEKMRGINDFNAFEAMTELLQGAR
tara:strand:+ start:3414 stop:5339 length:1926 start_codon:yes stop_codon:yes gene_type:complete